MLRTMAVLLMCSLSANAQFPSSDTLALSLRTMSKALAGCREVYTRVERGTTEPLMTHVVGKDNYDKDLESLGHAEKITNFLIAHPDKTSGKTLVAILSTADDFSVGVGSTRAAILTSLLDQSTKVSPSQAGQYVTAAAELNGCQRNLFNAGDDYVDLVMKYVAAEDDALASKSKSTPTR
jgi:hypothetical protein